MSGDFVVFLIGMRVNRPLKIHKWLPVASAMPRMLRWLDKHPEAGLLAWHNAWIKGPAVVQYWRSFEDLDRFARAAEEPHLPAWKTFNKAIRASGDVGIWHETYKVRAGEYESIYGTCRGSASLWPLATPRWAQPVSPPRDASVLSRSTSLRSSRTRTPELSGLNGSPSTIGDVS
jgi:hypothetical protein